MPNATENGSMIDCIICIRASLDIDPYSNLIYRVNSYLINDLYVCEKDCTCWFADYSDWWFTSCLFSISDK